MCFCGIYVLRFRSVLLLVCCGMCGGLGVVWMVGLRVWVWCVCGCRSSVVSCCLFFIRWCVICYLCGCWRICVLVRFFIGMSVGVLLFICFLRCCFMCLCMIIKCMCIICWLCFCGVC